MLIKFFNVVPNDTEVNVEITTPNKVALVICRGATELGKVVQWAISNGYQFHLTNNVDLAWVQQVRENINNGYSYL